MRTSTDSSRWLIGVLTGVFLSASSSLQAANKLLEPDNDNDGVSNYDDYCPQTPPGANVWTIAQYQNGEAHKDWVGCAGGDDQAAPGYTPPARPNPVPVPPPPGGKEYSQLKSLFAAGHAPQLQANFGWYSGRCWDSGHSEPVANLLFIETRNSPGPLFPPSLKFFTFYNLNQPANFYDQLSPELKLEVSKLIDSTWANLGEPVPTNSGFSASWNSGHGVQVREIRQSADNKYLFIWQNEGSGIPARYCYYPNKVTEFDF